ALLPPRLVAARRLQRRAEHTRARDLERLAERERAAGDRALRLGEPDEEGCDVDAAVVRRVRGEAAPRLRELARGRDRLRAARLVPRDGDVDETLQEVPLRVRRGAPRD